MHALTILQPCVAPLLGDIHRRRLAVRLEAVAAAVSGPRLTLAEIGRRFGGGSELRHRLKRADRRLGNVHLQREARGIYMALGRTRLAGVAEPLIVIDWSDLKEDQSLHLLRASLPVGGRRLTLYEEVHTQRKLGNAQVQHRFLQRLKALLPATAQPIIVADSGFRVQFYREAAALRRRAGVQRLARRRPLQGAGADRLLSGDPAVADRHGRRAPRRAGAHATRQPQASRLLADISGPPAADAGGLSHDHRRAGRCHRTAQPMGRE
jgi:hypothetical protein